LITRDELLARGMLHVPPAKRKSLSRRAEPDLFANLIDDEEPHQDDEDDEAVDDLP
jgi:hypothetical protein